MKYSFISSDPILAGAESIIVYAFKNQLSLEAKQLDTSIGSQLRHLLIDSGLENKSSGQEILHQTQCPGPFFIIVVQLGKREDINPAKLECALTTALRYLQQAKKKSALVCFASAQSKICDITRFYQLISSHCENTTYKYTTTITKDKSTASLKSIIFYEPRTKQLKPAEQGVAIGTAISQGISLSKQLSDLPANICTPNYLAEQAQNLAQGSIIKVTVLNENEMHKLGMHCILAVSKGSVEPARFIILDYHGGANNQAPVVLIGKGLTFDSGGISIKSADSMDEMKYDMCGGSSVMGTMLSISKMKLPVNVIGIVPCSENMINGQAFKPGDVITSMSGQTVEILSTDAEGRLILADALTYAQRYKPSIVIDIATLTGACITALGTQLSGLTSNNQGLANKLTQAGQQCNDYVWQLPLWEEYQTILDSNFADMASSAGRATNLGAGAIVAGCFLSRFAQKYRWAHLDIAGTAWLRGEEKGATGRPVALLCQFLINYNRKSF